MLLAPAVDSTALTLAIYFPRAATNPSPDTKRFGVSTVLLKQGTNINRGRDYLLRPREVGSFD
jgi:hypothetical protein